MTAYTTAYDHWLSQYWAQWLPEYSWLWGKAQLIVESGLDPNARSPAGALGLAQFMPDTFNDAIEALNFPSFASPLDPQYALQAFAWYMNKCVNSWHPAIRTQLDRLHLAQAQYNCGQGYLLQAQKLAQSNAYLDIINALPGVPHVDSKQVRDYVTKIGLIFLELTA